MPSVADMDPQRWRRIETLFHEARALAAIDRRRFLTGRCDGDDDLLREVERLLGESGEPPDSFFLKHGAVPVDLAPEITLTGQRLGTYVIGERLGAGGMGIVYRATDTTLRRQVAIKVLPVAVAADAARLARFRREAEMLAAVNHPNIAVIYAVERSGDRTALVMELVEGDDLSQRIARGPIPLDEALPIARQIAEALEAAHEQGVIHRDLKPANIKVRSDGTVKLLDFGLAKAMEPAASFSPSLSTSPTITTPAMTQAGMILGTAAYMSPEQARGQAVDKRTDIWAFGCVVYEMLTGRAVFPGATISDTIAAILEREPEWGALPARTPAGIRQLLRRCLDKDPNRRLHDIADARIEIDDDRSGLQQDGRVAQVPAGSRLRLAWASALALITLIAAAIGFWALRPVPTGPEVRLEINTAPTTDASLAMSPDGLTIVFAARSAGQSQLWLRKLDSSLAQPLAGTERASRPFWSPDSRSIGFFSDDARQLKRMDIAEGSVRTLASTPAPGGGAWSRDDTLIFSPNPGPIFRISAEGGEPSVATRVESPQQKSFLPAGPPRWSALSLLREG